MNTICVQKWLKNVQYPENECNHNLKIKKSESVLREVGRSLAWAPAAFWGKISRPSEVSEQMLLKANYVFCQLAVTATLWLQRAVVLMSGFSQSAFTVTVLHHAWHRQIFAIALGHSSVENLRHPQKHVNMWDPVFQHRRTSRNSPQIYMKTHWSAERACGLNMLFTI